MEPFRFRMLIIRERFAALRENIHVTVSLVLIVFQDTEPQEKGEKGLIESVGLYVHCLWSGRGFLEFTCAWRMFFFFFVLVLITVLAACRMYLRNESA